MNLQFNIGLNILTLNVILSVTLQVLYMF